MADMQQTSESRIPRDLTVFKKSMQDIVTEVTTTRSQKNSNPATTSYITEYDRDTVEEYISTGNIAQLRDISRYYFYRSGFYRRTLLYFATMLQYYTIVTPQFTFGKSPNQNKVMKKYDAALNFIDALNLELNCPEMMTKMFVDGAYYAIVLEFSEREIMFRELPTEYCRTIKQTGYGINLLEFDVSYFDKISDAEEKKQMLASFPKIVQKGYRDYQNKGQGFKWVIVPPDIGVAFTIGDQRPPMISVIPSIINLEEYRGLDRAKDEMDLQRVLVQKMPIHDGELVFTLEETAEIHKTTARMMQDVKYIDVLTTFADVTVPALKDTRQVVQDNLEKVEKSVYGEAGVSKEIFSPTRNLSLSTSLQNDLSYVMSIVQQIRTWVDMMIQQRFDDNTVHFDFQFLPITYYNQKDMTEMYLKQAQSGYSKLMPAIAAGTKQQHVMSLARFENDYLDMVPNLIPLQTSYTQPGTGEEETPASGSGKGKESPDNGRPAAQDGNREQKTDDNKQSDNGGAT